MKTLLKRLCYVTLSMAAFMPIQAHSVPICTGAGKSLQFDGTNFRCVKSGGVLTISSKFSSAVRSTFNVEKVASNTLLATNPSNIEVTH